MAAVDAPQYEGWFDGLLRTILDVRQGTIIDVGANVGQTLIKVISIDRYRPYIGFEPQLSCCFFIDQFISDNKLDNHLILPFGLSDSKGFVKLGLSQSNDVRASIIENYRPSGFFSRRKFVPIVSGDEVLPAFGVTDIALVKIDVEGGELEVIRGLGRTIRGYKPYIVFEVLPNYLVSTQQELDEETIALRNDRHTQSEGLLREMDYIIYQLEASNGLRRVEEVRAAKRQIHNYIAVPRNECVRFENIYSKVTAVYL